MYLATTWSKGANFSKYDDFLSFNEFGKIHFVLRSTLEQFNTRKFITDLECQKKKC